MTKKIFYFLFVIFNIFALIYLVYPLPSLPDLPNSVKSNLPGDTVQISHVTAYYTNMSRTEVMNFYKAYYTGLFRINLNHPPEKAKQVIVDTIPSYYLEEIVLPLKESLYINGFEWEQDVFTKPENRIKNKLIYEGKEYHAKITLRRFPVNIPGRIIVFFITQIALITTVLVLKSFTKHD